jgi:hypothetical protein
LFRGSLGVPALAIGALFFGIRGPDAHIWAITLWTTFLGVYLGWVMAFEYLEFAELHRLKARSVDSLLVGFIFIAIWQANRNAANIQHCFIWLTVVFVMLVLWELYTMWKGYSAHFNMSLVPSASWARRYRFVPIRSASSSTVRHWEEYRYWVILDGALIAIAGIFWGLTGGLTSVLSASVAGLIAAVTGTTVGVVNVLRYRVVLRNYRLPGTRAYSPTLKEETPTPAGLLSKKFQVALSFPGEKREYVAKVAQGLSDVGVDVFYDRFYEAELALPNSDIHLQTVYHDNSDLIVVFICEEYQEKEWCGLEWRAIRDLIKKKRAAAIMFMRFDDAELSGTFSIDGYVDLRGRTPTEAVELICRRLAVASSGNASRSPGPID